MNDEMSTRLAQELLGAADEDARARVVVRWLPDFARCQVTTAARVKAQGAKIDALGEKVDSLSDKIDAYHSPKKEEAVTQDEKRVDPRLERLRLILAFAQRNWQGVAIVVILAKALGLLGDLTLKDLLPFLN